MLTSQDVWAAVSDEINKTKGYHYQLKRWQQVVVTVNEGGMTMYANGAKLVQSPWKGKPAATNEQTPLMIGSYDNKRFFRGDIGEVIIWKQALGDRDIRTLYLAGAQRYRE
jgi:hypothetical protein